LPKDPSKQPLASRSLLVNTRTFLLWIIDPDSRILAAHAPEGCHTPASFSEADMVKAFSVLPGFEF
jgi:hypothetical protein